MPINATRPTRFLNAIIFYGLLGVVFFTPLLFGSNVQWAWNLDSVAIACLSLLWSCLFLLNKHWVPCFKYPSKIADLIIIFLMVMGWICAQIFYPVTFEAANPIWQQAASLLSFQVKPFLTLTPDDTWDALLRLISYGLVFWLSLSYCQDRKRAQQVFYGFTWVGFAYAVYGLVIYFGDFKSVLWIEKKYYVNDVTSTFINRNHFATFCGFALLCATVMVNEVFENVAKHHVGGRVGLQRFIETLIIRAWLPVLVFIVIGIGLIQTHSRGGFGSTLVSLILLLGVSVVKARSKKSVVYFYISAIVLGCLIFYLGSDSLLKRLDAQGLEDASRDETYALTWQASVGNPWTGFGFGSFLEAFTAYKSNRLGSGVWDYAHNSYVELIFELGFPAALALIYCFFRFFMVSVFAVMKSSSHNLLYSTLGLSVTTLLAIHALVDFSIQIPAIAYSYCLLIGASCGQAFAKMEHRERTLQ